MKWSSFRGWVHDLWVQNCDEHQQYHLRKFSEREYFQQYKWWLKREYTYRKREAARKARQAY